MRLLSDQTHMLNTKLVGSISKHADLEDQIDSLHHTRLTLQTNLDELQTKHSTLDEQFGASTTKNADLTSDLTALRTQHEELGRRAEELEKAKTQFEESMNTGLLVERTVIRDEMQKLAQGLVEEERRRGSAEEGRRKVEGEVDDLAASLFDQVRDSFCRFGLS